MSDSSLRDRAYKVIFEAETPAGKAFDVGLLWAIGASVLAVCMESVAGFAARYGSVLRAVEWVFTVVFGLEYVLRLWCARSALRYARSFYGVIDLISVLPSVASLVVPGAQSLLAIRALRLLRVFRILKLGRYLRESEALAAALVASRRKIAVFLFAVLVIVIWLGALMYLIEGPEAGFTSIPRAMYWAIVTLTTVGYGDIAPRSTLGQILASVLMILGYGIIAVPTGIVTAELTHPAEKSTGAPRLACPGCARTGHASDAVHCKFCGARLSSRP